MREWANHVYDEYKIFTVRTRKRRKNDDVNKVRTKDNWDVWFGARTHTFSFSISHSYTHTRTHTHVHTLSLLHIHTYTHIHIQTLSHTHTYIHTHTHTHTEAQTTECNWGKTFPQILSHQIVITIRPRGKFLINFFFPIPSGHKELFFMERREREMCHG